MPLLELRNLAVYFKAEKQEFAAVQGLNFSLNAGESLAIVGESGSGKSVSLKAMMGLLPQRAIARIEGEALFTRDNKTVDLLKLSQKELRPYRGKGLAMIFQEPMTALNPVMRCGEQILEAVLLHTKLKGKEAKNRVLALLEEVRVSETERIYKSYPHEVSGGQRQRVMIAMALAGDPQVLIADEPTTALDVSVQASILELLKRLKEERGMALIFISHDLGVVKQIADRCLVMFRGVKLEEQNADDLFRSPQHVYTKALLACRPGARTPGTRLPVMRDFFDLTEEGEFIPKTLAPGYEALHTRPEQNPYLKIEDLKVSYLESGAWASKQKKEVIHGLDFEIFKGETLGLLGESGSGKSTLGRAIMQLIRYSGKVWLEGKNLNGKDSLSRRKLSAKIQLIYQDPYASLNPVLRVGDALDEVMLVHGEGDSKKRKAACIAMLERVGLSESDLAKYPHEFSGGQRQRISIARALLCKPEFIVCDESVAALDVSVQAQVLNLLMELKAEFGLTYLFITHDLQVVKHIADRVLVLNKGGIADLQATADLFRNPQDEYTKNLLEAYPVA
ncbi:MAG: ABC transporter ATP-binding protein [Bacteroidetes bacterium]|nr:MAG: ABC transporter ATP-binding protein [Bacteroidota bacterium]